MALSGSAWPHRLLPIDADGYAPHGLHADERDWSETNCYTDVWIELLHALGTEPLAVAAYTLTCDFEGTQWSFFKPPIQDLRGVYGIEVSEMNVWRPVLDHVIEHLAAGRLLTVEVDAYHLPDTAGTSYHAEHVKTTIVPQAVDPIAGRLGYFHGRGYYELEGDDFAVMSSRPVLPPYVELVRLPASLPPPEDLLARSLASLRSSLGRLPVANPVERMAETVEAEVPSLAGAGVEHFHGLAFATLRQCGAGAAMAGDYLRWLDVRTGEDLAEAAAGFDRVAEGAKAAQFALARAARGRTVDVRGPLRSMAGAWAEGTAALLASRIIGGQAQPRFRANA